MTKTWAKPVPPDLSTHLCSVVKLISETRGKSREQDLGNPLDLDFVCVQSANPASHFVGVEILCACSLWLYMLNGFWW